MNPENVLIVGNGAREHAIGSQINRFSCKRRLFFAPGNAGTEQIGTNLDISPSDVDKIIKTAKDNNAFVIVGPEAPLGKGIANAAREDGVTIFGPTQEAARLETSKSYAINFMEDQNIPHPTSTVITNFQEAIHFFDESVWEEIVIKADGLAAGKGVFLPNSRDEALTAIRRIMIDHEFDDGSKVIIQKRLKGREISLIAITDGKTIVPLLPAQDYKRVNDNDKGPNTGGMGAFAPAPMSSKLCKQVYDTILKPTVDGMREEGNIFQGALFVGLMLTDDGPQVLEFNVRFGDPETQVLMMLLNSDLLKALKNTADGRLKNKDIVFHKGAAICAVLAAEGYPGKPITGDEIYGIENITNPDIQLFHAGTISKNGKILTNGGRIISAAAYGKNRGDARERLYLGIRKADLSFRGMHYRKDIGL